MNSAFLFFNICRFKAGPADVPNSHGLLKITLLVYFMLGVGINRVDVNWQVSLFASLADTLMMVLVIWILLNIRGLQARYLQTVTAMAGTGCFLAIIGLPIYLSFHQVSEPEQASSFTLLLMVALMFWSLMVMAHIFRQALDIKPGAAAALTIGYTVLSLIAVGLLISGIT